MTDVTRSIYMGMKVLIGQSLISDQAVIVEEDKIQAIIPVNMVKHHLPAIKYEYPADHYMVPGFIDLHVHGAEGHDVMDNSVLAMQGMCRALAREGVTGFLATTLSASPQEIEAVLSTVSEAAASLEGAAILGVHLEGPFIAKEKRGAQQGERMLPDMALMRSWQKAAKDTIKVVTLAPELSGALAFIQALSQSGVIVSIGHTNATYTETCAGITAGCTQATHLFNAMSGMHQREPGASGALLLSNEVVAELIVDGMHLHPAMVELAMRIKGKDRLLLVTDAMRAKCRGDGQYDLGGQPVTVKNGRATLTDGTLAGSTLRMPQAIKNMADFAHCSLEEAIYMATCTPARVLGLSRQKGSIEVGKDADLVILNDAFEVVSTLLAGHALF
ncbi:MAG: N-acetylglucosamine-6-phosphate deacetylase [Gammaproteobacteria bacterium RIFCSPHIGHO2_12_FULL_45_12]|nr:MAG: N-acetylglucosamine-6-phosphate deacetylase [Gammaproteobacteria bacterium RIFCSPHIGHO2_12_FULL_45_12]